MIAALLIGLLALAPQEPAPAPAPPAADPSVSPEQAILDELREQASEDLRVWEARVVARKSWVREASLRVDTAKGWREATEKRTKLGYEGSGVLKLVDLELAELEARRDQKIVEWKEAESRVARLKRRVAMLSKISRYDVLGQALAPGSPFLGAAENDRILDLEQQVERLRAEMDETRQTARQLRQEMSGLETGGGTGVGKGKASTVSPR